MTPRKCLVTTPEFWAMTNHFYRVKETPGRSAKPKKQAAKCEDIPGPTKGTFFATLCKNPCISLKSIHLSKNCTFLAGST